MTVTAEVEGRVDGEQRSERRRPRLPRLPRLPHRSGDAGPATSGRTNLRAIVFAGVAGFRQATSWVSLTGWVAVIGAAIGVGIGLSQDWTELWALGLTCAFCLAIAGTWTLTGSSFEVTFDLHHGRVSAGDTATGRVLLRNRARRLYFPARIELSVGQGRSHFMTTALAHDEVYEQLFEVPTRRRCVIPIGPVHSVKSDPLGLLRRTQRWSDSVDLYVHPVTVVLSSDSTGFIRDIEGVTTQDLSSNDVSFHALREYQPGDDRRAIHWRTTARVNKLMVRQFEETRRAHLLIVLPTALADYADETDFESAVSIAGSLARNAYREEREVSIYTSSGLLSFRGATVMLDRLSELRPAVRSLSLRDLTLRALGAVPQTSVCALVAGSSADPRDLRAAHKSLPLAVTTFALRCHADVALTRRRIGDLNVVDLPDVHSLARAMRSLG